MSSGSRDGRSQVRVFARYAVANLIFGLFALSIGLTNLVTGFFGGSWITRACFLMTAVALAHAVPIWRSRFEARLPPERTMVRVTRLLAAFAVLFTLAFALILYVVDHDLVAAILVGLVFAFSLGNSILLARKMAEPPRS